MCSKLAMDYSITHFKGKAADLGSLYSTETVKLLSQYNQLRNISLAKDKMLSKTLNYLIKQENIINELRTFIEVFLHPMLDLVEKETGGICQSYL